MLWIIGGDCGHEQTVERVFEPMKDDPMPDHLCVRRHAGIACCVVSVNGHPARWPVADKEPM